MTRLKIDITNGIVEAEGEEGFVQAVFAEYKEFLLAARAGAPRIPSIPTRVESAPAPKVAAAPAAKTPSKSKPRKESYSIVGDLDLSPNGGKQALREFAALKGADAGLDKNAVFVYYLKKIAKVANVAVDHVYTCYKDVGDPVPVALKQSLLDSSSRKSTIDTSSMTDIKLTTRGENFVEHDLPKKPAKGKA